MVNNDLILKVENLRVTFPIGGKEVAAVDNLSFSLAKGKILGIVGESGCGKSLTALSLLKLIDEPGRIASGSALYFGDWGDLHLSPVRAQPYDETIQQQSGVDLLKLREAEMRGIRGNKISMIFQEPMTSLNPVLTIGEQVSEVILLHQKVSKREAHEQAIAMLQKVRIPDAERRFKDYPHQLSGGMRQRVLIAIALACKPDILIADEPTTALDVTIQAQILELIRELIAEMSMSVLLITHDLGVIAQLCDDVLVMYAGMAVEQAPAKRLFQYPKHPYTLGLLRSLPPLFGPKLPRLEAIPGLVPALGHMPEGCRFADRCPRVAQACRPQIPKLKYIGEKQSVLCLNY